MLSYYDNSPRQIKEAELGRIDKEIQQGVYDPMPELRSRIETDARRYRRNMISTGLTTGFLGAVGLGTLFSLTPILIGTIAGGCLLVFSAKGIGAYVRTKRDLQHDDVRNYILDSELEDLDRYQKTFKPSTDQAKQTQLLIKEICDDLLEEEEEEGETIDAKAEEVKDEPKYDNPWLKDAKVSTVQVKGNPVKKLTLQEDSFVDKVDKEVDKAVDNRLGGELNEIRHVQGEQMDAITARLDEFEKTFIFAIEKLASTPGSNSDSREFNSGPSARPLGIPMNSREFSGGTDSELNSESTLNQEPHPEISHVTPGDFDPEKPEKEKEFLTFKSLVELNDYNPKGNPIIERMWRVKPGGSKRFKAACIRRDTFSDRLDEFYGPESELYGGQ